jgi:hypothetical protein
VEAAEAAQRGLGAAAGVGPRADSVKVAVGEEGAPPAGGAFVAKPEVGAGDGSAGEPGENGAARSTMTG